MIELTFIGGAQTVTGALFDAAAIQLADVRHIARPIERGVGDLEPVSRFTAKAVWPCEDLRMWKRRPRAEP